MLEFSVRYPSKLLGTAGKPVRVQEFSSCLRRLFDSMRNRVLFIIGIQAVPSICSLPHCPILHMFFLGFCHDGQLGLHLRFHIHPFKACLNDVQLFQRLILYFMQQAWVHLYAISSRTSSLQPHHSEYLHYNFSSYEVNEEKQRARDLPKHKQLPNKQAKWTSIFLYLYIYRYFKIGIQFNIRMIQSAVIPSQNMLRYNFIRNNFSTMIYLIRHAQSRYNEVEHNIKRKVEEDEQAVKKDYQKTEEYLKLKFDLEGFEDVDITELGSKQCIECAQKLVKEKIDIDLVIVSPFRRALATCHEVFKIYKQKMPNKQKLNIIVDPDFREIFESCCDVGSRLRESIKDYPEFDYTLVKNPDFWFLETIVDPEIKKRLLDQVLAYPEQKRAQAAKYLMLKQLQKIWFERQASEQANLELKKKMLPPVSIQKNKLKFLSEKYKSIAVVTHSENIKSYIGYKPANCSIVRYKHEYLDHPHGSQIPKDEL